MSCWANKCCSEFMWSIGIHRLIIFIQESCRSVAQRESTRVILRRLCNVKKESSKTPHYQATSIFHCSCITLTMITISQDTEHQKISHDAYAMCFSRDTRVITLDSQQSIRRSSTRLASAQLTHRELRDDTILGVYSLYFQKLCIFCWTGEPSRRFSNLQHAI